jgi:HlyD family secretion protein
MSREGRQIQAAAVLRKSLPALMLVLVLLLTFVLWVNFRTPPKARAAATSQTRVPDQAVGCLGYIEPKDGVLQLTAPYLDGRPQRVLELKVKQGDEVRTGQLLAVLDGKEPLQSALRLAEARVGLAQARLSQVKAGASASDIAAQKAAVSRIQAALDHARVEYHRYSTLHQQTDVSASELDARRLAVQTDEQELQSAEQRLNSISQVRPTDIDVAQSDLSVAIAEAQSARVNLQSAMVYAPVDAQVLRIQAYPGETPGSDGLLELAKAGPMYVEAEVYESDIARVRPGERARITSDLFPGTVSGVVETVGTMISKAEVMPLDPVAFADRRVFKVWIRLDEANRVAGLIHGKANVVIEP